MWTWSHLVLFSAFASLHNVAEGRDGGWGGGVLAQVPFLSTCSVSLERCVRAPTNYACAREVRLPALQPAQPAA